MSTTKQLLQSAIIDNSLILTGNNRLARWLQRRVDDHQRKQGKKVWMTPTIMPLDSWLQHCWHQALITAKVDSPLLLQEPQQQLLWEMLITASTGYKSATLAQTAIVARQAWQLLNHWKINSNNPLLTSTEAGQKLAHWGKQLIKEYPQFIDHARLLDQMTTLIATTTMTLPKKILLSGFLEFNPMQAQLIAQLKKSKVAVDTQQPLATQTSNAYKIALPDTACEITTMAQWAKQRLQQHPNASIACIIPELNSLRPMVERTFRHLLPSGQFNISGGASLAKEAVIDSALVILGLSKNELTIDEISQLLRSPFIGNAITEREARALLDFKLRQHHHTNWSVEKILLQAKCCGEFEHYLRAYQQLQTTVIKSPSQWASKFSWQLLAFKWPGERQLNSREYQAVNHWQQLLAQFACLDVITVNMTYLQALTRLIHMAENQTFQIKTANAPIQILGLLEAIGLEVNYIWVMGLDNTCWPKASNPNPFIPSALQMQLGLPQSSAKRELFFAKLMTKQLIAATHNDIIFSHAKQQQDQLLFASSLIKNFKEITLPFKHSLINYNKPLPFEYFQDNNAPTINSTEKVIGGSSILKAQAACPFRAFAYYRLQAQTLPLPQLGLSAKDRGIITHKVLQLLWQQIGNHQVLCQLNDNQLITIVKTSIDQALSFIIYNKQLALNFIKIERQRLQSLIVTYLALEKKRQAFTVVAIEKRQTITLAGINLTLQVDRIDQLQDGSYLIIDYKTGQIKNTPWIGARLDEPQLPLYAAMQQQMINGIYFAQIRCGEVKFIGDDCGNYITNKAYTKAAWQQQLNQWSYHLTQLAKNFAKGDAMVDPKYQKNTCKSCDLHTLCRIYDKTT